MDNKEKLEKTRFQFNKGVLYYAIKRGYVKTWGNIEQCKPQVQ